LHAHILTEPFATRYHKLKKCKGGLNEMHLITEVDKKEIRLKMLHLYLQITIITMFTL